MTLDELLEAAYRSDYIRLDDLDELNNFTKIWKDLLDVPLEDLHLSRVPKPDTYITKVTLSSAYGQMFRS